tara:strand:- start:170 stop:628 length:459 start_codon:yes stop_codon:yes gene_type:complete
MNIKFKWKIFEELSKDELYAVLNLRQKVFIVEQNCPYIDLDYADQRAYHLLVYFENELIGYLRAFSPGIKYDESSLGRITTVMGYRNKGIGKKITNEGVSFLLNKYPDNNIVISAQHRLIKFYQELDFKERGEVYLEDDIDHIEMCLDCTKR